MNCHTLDRFRGAWLGSMLGCGIELRAANRLTKTEWQQYFVEREKLAETLIESQGWDTDTIVDRLISKRLKSDRYKALRRKNRELNLLNEYSYYLQLLLPLIILYGDNWSLLREIVRKCYSKLGNLSNSLELEADILLWSYLVISILSGGFESDNLNFALLVEQTSEQILKDVSVEKTALTTQLEMVATAVERGESLQQLSDKLLNWGTGGQTAIALSYYCFITTTSDFQLSVERASNSNSKIAGLATVLTATLSGAYNGIAGIPINWKKMAEGNLVYQSASQTILELFRAWLGIHPARDELESNLEIQAFAASGLIQSRKSLRIISLPLSLGDS